MFLSKSSRRYYYLFFLDQAGRRHKISTKCKLKSDALEFLKEFDRVAKERTARRRQVTLSKFKDEYLTYSKTNHSPKTTEIIATSFRELLRITGDILLVDVDTKDIERFIARKTAIASARTARTYLVTLASAFETARRWGFITDNPFRNIEKPKLPELAPTYFTKQEFAELLKNIDDGDFRELVLCAVATGMRLGELAAL